MDKTITEDVGQAVKVGLTVYDGDGSQVGYVDQVDKRRGWMLVRAGAVDQKKLWIPYRLVRSVDERELFVTHLKGALEAEFGTPPPRSTKVRTVDGRTMATTTEPGGYDGQPVITSEVDVDQVKQRLAVDQRVWTSDDAAFGSIASFDSGGRYVVVREGFLSREKHVLMPIALIADVDREAAEVVLAVSADDLARMKRPEAADFVIELQSRLDY